jgi:type II secretory pathway pseudopilin PulG
MVEFFRKKILAFTLAEVLITLGIIGVVSAMTIPTLTSNIAKKRTETQIKANVSIIKQALRYSIVEGIDYSYAIADGNTENIKTWFETYFLPYVKINKVCYDSQGCWHKAGVVKSLTGNAPKYENDNGIGGNIVTFQISNGTLFDVDGNTASDMASFGLDTTSDGLTFYFDANGEQKPNRIGQDIYIMVWTSQGLVPAGYNRTASQVENNCLKGDGYFCLQYVMTHNWEIANSVWNKKI